MFKKLSGLLTIWCVLLLTGCLDYEQQTLTYRYDLKSDTLRIFQVYQGIFGEDQPEGLSDKELDQLQSVLSGQRTFFFANWIWEYDREEVRKGLDNLNKPDSQPDATLDPAARSRRETFLNLLLDNAHLENGAFYLDDQGKLCAVQSVTVSHFSKLVAAGNGQIRDLFKVEANGEKVTVEEHTLYLKYAGQQRPYITINGNQVRFRLPITRTAFEKSYGPDSSAAKQLEEFRQQGGKVAFANNEMKWSVGTPSDQVTTLTLPVSTKPYVANALDAVKSRAVIHGKMDVAATAKVFVQGAAPDAKPQRH